MRKKRDEIWRDKWDQTILNEIDDIWWDQMRMMRLIEIGWDRWKWMKMDEIDEKNENKWKGWELNRNVEIKYIIKIV